MTRTTPRVVGTTLSIPETEVVLEVGSEAWFAWLITARNFAYTIEGATFTARKQQRRAQWYWYAFASRNRKVVCRYLGRSADLTAVRLAEVAHELHPDAAVGLAAKKLFGARSAKAVAVQQRVVQGLEEMAQNVSALKTDGARRLLEWLVQQIEERRRLRIGEVAYFIDSIEQLLLAIDVERAQREMLVSALRTVLHERPFPRSEGAGEVY